MVKGAQQHVFLNVLAFLLAKKNDLRTHVVLV